MRRHGYIIGGQVQGVGFRPFVYRAATRHGLTGHVGNTSDGVRVEVQGSDEALAAFAHALEHGLPPLARITSLRREELPLADGETAFAIAHSEGRHGHAVLVSPDVATCGNCLADMRDPANRRYRYPFTNCTDCGPRYTITRSIPYDRATTSMSCFPLCPDCAAEYNDPLDRRFHAQPNACPACGPKVWLAAAPEGDPRIPGPELAEGQHAIERTAAALRAGNIVAVKGLGGFHLVCDAASAEAVALLRERKRRPHKSLAIMVPDLETARRVAHVSDAEAAALTSSERPIVVLASRGVLPPAIAPDVDSIGVMLPYTPLHHLLLEAFAALSPLPALVMTSGNAGGEPISLGNREALARLRHIADLFLLHNRDILIRADDSVVRVEPLPETGFSTGNNPQCYPQKNGIPSACSPSLPDGAPAGLPSTSAENVEGEAGDFSSGSLLREAPPLHFFRRARGFVPRPLELPRDAGRCVLATGAELKNTLCLTRGKDAFLSQHVGDLKNLETFAFFQDMAEHLGGLLEVKPEAVVCDLHPDYLSTSYALDSGLPVLRLQHHFAHVYGVLAENGHDAPALGLALDGTGYGTDGTIWGGELLFVDPKAAGEERYGGRIGRLAPFPLPGGEAAIREPWRIASGFMGLPEAEGLRGRFAEDMHALLRVDGKRAVHDAILEMVRREATPMTSSCGRLFDAVSALLGLCPSVTYEGQAAIRLEAQQDLSVTTSAPFPIRERGGLLELDTAAFFLHLLELRRAGVPVPDLARRFHLGLTEGLAELALSGARRCGVRTVALSGGVFHNRTIALLLPEALARRGLVPLTHHALPPGDGGLSYGQAAWASHVLR
ncbi:MAG: carbamoyltransferase HypF [Bilophila sp.]|nr:carbamoyltransferase HypF [Bilophila sp.]